MKTRVQGAPTLAIFGNLTMDEVVTNGALRVAPGGSALYVSATAALLGARVDVFSHVGMDYPARNLVWLKNRGVGVEKVSRTGGETCRFRLSYRKGSRTLRLIDEGPRLKPIGINGMWKAAHLGPVFGEVPLSMIPTVRHHSSFVSMDLQGFLRKPARGGRVVLRPVEVGKILPFVDLLKATIGEALVQTSTLDVFSAVGRILRDGPRCVIVTMGRKGAVLAEKNGKVYRIPAYPEANAIDPTGAGDALVGGWLATFLSTGDPVWATSVGSALASMLVRRPGLAKFRLSRRELFRRSAWVFTRIRPLEL